IYLAASRQFNSGDEYTIPIWYSADDGISWYSPWNLSWGGHHLYNPSLKIVETPDTDYMFIAFEAYETSSPYNQDILVYRYNFVSGSGVFFYPANDPNIDEKDPSLDSDDLQYPNSPYLYLAFESEDSIVFMRSTDEGDNWTQRTVIGSGSATYDYIDPSCAFGWHNLADSFNVGVAWVCSTPQGYRGIRFRRNRLDGYSGGWLPIRGFSPPANCQDTRPSLKLTHDGYPSGVIIFERKDTVGVDNMNLCNHYTYNGGRAWANDTLYYGGDYNVLTTLSVDDSLGDYHAFFKGDYDDIRYKEAHYDDFSEPGGWTGSIPISDGGNISNTVSPASAVRDGEPCVCWKIYTTGNDTLKFDALWLQTGVEEEPIEEISTTPFSLTPNPSNGIAMLSYTVEKEGNVKISLHDITGRTIKNLLDENKGNGRYSLEINNKELPSGIYFVHIKTSDGVYTKSMTVLK
ncbi:T9SS type A sorting domain-containing protein, partial [candidate division WOR-3 bacterium]|nr:T9SS type A sorting domain-containing protein [candidate division WOR-3 bacterium]